MFLLRRTEGWFKFFKGFIKNKVDNSKGSHDRFFSPQLINTVRKIKRSELIHYG